MLEKIRQFVSGIFTPKKEDKTSKREPIYCMPPMGEYTLEYVVEDPQSVPWKNEMGSLAQQLQMHYHRGFVAIRRLNARGEMVALDSEEPLAKGERIGVRIKASNESIFFKEGWNSAGIH